MSFVDPRPLVQAARVGGYAVPAFNSNGGTYELTRAALQAAQQERSPLILQVYEPNCEFRGFAHSARVARGLIEDLGIDVPVALQVDHGKSPDSAERAFAAGFTSFMIDASAEPFDSNVATTRRVLELAAPHGAAVEAEIGHVTGNEPQAAPPVGRAAIPLQPPKPPATTDVDEARRFTEAVPVDMLAVAIGTTHGCWQRQTAIDYHLLARLRDAVDVPLVMHGTAGIALEDIGRLARGGMAKINFGEPFRMHWIQHVAELMDTTAHQWHPWRLLRDVTARLTDEMTALIQAMNAAGKAG